ncbi:MAG: efflux RND transporter permease subunit [Boseongicola sp.]|nr:efflux RND transporter permease subunit [Boseongicola sp.]
MIAYFSRHPVAANLLLLGTLILGGLSLPDLERESFPESLPSMVSVLVAYPGASAADVDDLVCLELDAALRAVDDLDELECLSVEGRATATLTMAQDGEIGQFYNDVLSTVSATGGLPAETEAPVVSILGQTELVALVAVSGIATEDGLIRYADSLATNIAALKLVHSVDVSGVSENEFRVSLDQKALRRYGVSADAVSDAMSARSLRAPVGTVSTEGRSIVLRYSDARRTISELEDLVVLQNASGALVRLSDLAEVTLEELAPELRAFMDGQRAAILRINKTRKADAIDAFDQVEALLDRERARYPAPFRLTVINNTTEVIRDRIALVGGNAVASVALVILVMCFFFTVREAVWISLALPFSFFAAAFAMSVIGVSINMISLVALLMSVGLIMDDSIVIAENVANWRERGGSGSVARGVLEVMPGVVCSFLTTACVFAPLMFLSGEVGAILKVIPLVLLITMGASLLEAFLVLPNHMAQVRVDSRANAGRLAPRMLVRLRDGFVLPAAALLMRWRYLTVGFVFAILISSLGLIASGTVKVIVFPTIEGDTIEARIALTPGLPLGRTQAVVRQIEDSLGRIDEELSARTEGGQPLVLRVLTTFASNVDVKDNGPHTATITVDLLNSEERNVSAEEVLSRWRAASGPIPDLVQANFTQTALGPGGNDLEVQLFGQDLAELELAADDLRSRLLARDDVTAAYQDFYAGQPEIQLTLNEFAFASGLTPQSLVSQLRAAFSGTETDSFRVGQSGMTVNVELDDSIPSIVDLEAFPIAIADGKQVSLGSIADLDRSLSYGQITRQNGKAVARIIGQIDRDVTTSTEISRTVVDELAPLLRNKFSGVAVEIGGGAEAQQEFQNSILTAFLFGLIGVYIVLAFQFRSYALPLMIMLSIPFAIVGMVFGHLLMGLDISMPSLIGFASLAGVVVNNSILFVTFFIAAIRESDYLAAAIQAVRSRFRPALLSSLTTFVGLLPILTETSPQAQVLVPLVVSVAFGLLSSTLIVAFVFPCMLGIYFDFRDVGKWLAGFDAKAADDNT